MLRLRGLAALVVMVAVFVASVSAWGDSDEGYGYRGGYRGYGGGGYGGGGYGGGKYGGGGYGGGGFGGRYDSYGR